jgi:hypothetical protein
MQASFGRVGVLLMSSPGPVPEPRAFVVKDDSKIRD